MHQLIFVQYLPIYFNQQWASNYGYQREFDPTLSQSPTPHPRALVIIALSTNFIGYGLAGLARQFLVYPSRAVWPANLASVALNVSGSTHWCSCQVPTPYSLQRTFHTETNQVVDGWTISRMRWFMYCFGAMLVYFWFPGYIIQAMSYFNWITWIAPDNVILAAVTGSVGGLGLNPFPTWDWNQLSVYQDPLIVPFYSSFC
jgi:hypothetical protein